MDVMKSCLIGLPCIPVDERTRDIELSRRMMKARNKQIDKGRTFIILDFYHFKKSTKMTDQNLACLFVVRIISTSINAAAATRILLV